MAFKIVNLAQHEILPVQKLLELMREARPMGKTHILAIAIGKGSVEFSVAVPRGRVVVENSEFDIVINSN